jgi:hypothetical protein
VKNAGSQQIEGKPLVILQINCRRILNNNLEFRNFVDTYKPDVIISTETWLREEINNTEVFRVDYTTFRTGRCTGEVECSFVLKATSIAGSYVRMKTLRG